MKTKMTSRLNKPRFVVDAIEQRVLLAPVCTFNGTSSSWNDLANWNAVDTTALFCSTTGGADFTYVFSGTFANQPTLDVDINALELQFFGDSPIILSGSNIITLAPGGFIKFGQATVTTPVAHTVAPNIVISGSGATIVHYTSVAGADTTLALNGAVTGPSIPLHVTSVDGFTPATTGGFVKFTNTGNTFGNLTVDNDAGSLGDSVVGGRVEANTGAAITIDQNGADGSLGRGEISLNKGTLNLPSIGTLTWTSGTLTAEGGATFTATSTTDVVLAGGAMNFNGSGTIGSITATTTLVAQAGFALNETVAASVTLTSGDGLTWTAGTLEASGGATFNAESTAAGVVFAGGQMNFSGGNTTGLIEAATTLEAQDNFTLVETGLASVTLISANNLTWGSGNLTVSGGAGFNATSTTGNVTLGGGMTFNGASTEGSITATVGTLIDQVGFVLNQIGTALLTFTSGGTLTWTSGTLTAEDGATFTATSTTADVVLSGGQMNFNGSDTIGSITAATTLVAQAGFALNETVAASLALTSAGDLTWTAGTFAVSGGAKFNAMSSSGNVALNGGSMNFNGAGTEGIVTATEGTLSAAAGTFALDVGASVTLTSAGDLTWASGTLTAENGAKFNATSTTGNVALNGGSMNFNGAGTEGSITATTTLADAATFTLNETTGALVTLKSGTITTLNGNHNVNASTLTLESSDAFLTSTPTTGGINLTAGALKFAAAANINNALGLPILSLGAGASTIDFSGIPANAPSNSTAITVSFANSSAATWDGTLGINAWSGSPRTALLFGTNSNGLTATQVNEINSWANIQNGAGITSAVQSLIVSTGQAIPLLTPNGNPTYAAALVAINTYLGCYPSTTIASNGQYPWICSGVCGGGIPDAKCPDAAPAPGVASIAYPLGAMYAATPAGGLTGPAAAEAIFNMINESFEGSNLA